MLTPFETFMLFAIACALWFIWLALAVIGSALERMRAVLEQLEMTLRGRR